MMLQQAFDLNTQGIFSLASGKAGRTSIVAIKQAMQAMDALFDDEVGFPRDMVKGTAPEEEPTILRCRAVSVPALQDDQFFIFNYAFLFAPTTNATTTRGSRLSPTDMAYGSAVLTFNMALTYHRLGMQMGSSRKLRTACLLYGKVVEMASVAAVESQPSHTHESPSTVIGSDLYFLHLVALNNAAQIQYRSASFLACDELLSHVRYMLQELFEQPESDYERLMSVLPAGALDEIKLNTVVCNIPSTAPTA